MNLRDTFPPVWSANSVRNPPTSLEPVNMAPKRSISAGHARQGSVMHTFRTLRHYNELQQSIHRADTDYHAQVFLLGNESDEPPLRTVEQFSGRRLRDYSLSEYDHLGEVKNFKKKLLEERARQRAIQLLHNQTALNLGCVCPSPQQLARASTSLSTLGPRIEPLTSAKAKLAKYSLSFDPLARDNQRVIFGFHGQRLSREDFGKMLRQAMHLFLTFKEVDALYGTMEVSPDGTFDGREFTRKFCNLGNSVRREKYIGMAREEIKLYGARKMSNRDKEGER